jgi:hypothetical protein
VAGLVLAATIFLNGPAVRAQPTRADATAPSARIYHTAVWTGSEMIIWGGLGPSGIPENTGARYNPTTDTWTVVPTNGAPAGRYYHTAIWNGSEMIVWGGITATGNVNTGARYNPLSNTWTALPVTGAPAKRFGHTAVAAGTSMVIWGGTDASDLNTGAIYSMVSNNWAPTSLTGAPAARRFHTAVWTGSEMLVWGGFGDLNTGGRYSLASNSWSAITTNNAPQGRVSHSAAWSGSEMLIWGGTWDDPLQPDLVYLQTGGRFSPASGAWTAMSTNGAPSGRSDHTALWAGSRFIVWGGYYPPSQSILSDGRQYNVTSNAWAPISSSGAPSARYLHSAVWTGSQMIIWGGFDGTAFLKSGARYTAAADSWGGVSNTAPSATLTSPVQGTTYPLGPVNIELSATGTDPDGVVVQMDFLVNGMLVGSDTTPPFTFTYSNAPPGSYTMLARAVDNLGGTGLSSPIEIFVNGPPAVTVTFPTNNTLHPAGDVHLVLSAADGDINDVTVELREGATMIGSFTSSVENSPFTFIWSNVVAGSHTITATITDEFGISSTSAPVTFTAFATNDPPGVVAWWKLDEGTGTNAFDSSGFTNTAFLTLGPLWTNNARINGGVVFDGTDDYLRVPDIATNLDFNGKRFTVALWARTTRTTKQLLVEKQGAEADSFRFAIDRDDAVEGGFSVYSGSAWIDCSTNNRILTNGQWHHLAVTHDRTNFVLYLDGKVDRIQAGIESYKDSTQPFNIGRSFIKSGWNFQGTLDDIRVYNRALSASEIAALHWFGNRPPVVSITNPPTGTAVQVPGQITLNSDATDADGQVTKVEYYHGAALLGLAVTNPFSLLVDELPSGSYSLTARAYDNHGAFGLSAPITVVVNTLPAVSLTNPPPASAQATGTALLLGVSASDPDGTVTQVEFYNGPTLLGTVTNPPFTLNLTNLASGTYTFRAVATDNLDQASTSAPVSFTASLAPNVTLTNPASATMFSHPGQITLGAAASDPDGTVSTVGFFANGTLLSQVGGTTFTSQWNNVALGAYAVTAVATDNSGVKQTSAPVNISVVLVPRMDVARTGTNVLVSVSGETNKSYRVDVSTNFVTWTPFQTNLATNGLILLLDTNTAPIRRFYRALPLP